MEKRTFILRQRAMGSRSPVGPQIWPLVRTHPAQRLPQEVGGAPGGVGPALSEPGHQHVAAAGGGGQQRMIAPLAGVAVVARPLLDP